MAGSSNNIDTGALYFGTVNPTLTGQEVDNDSFIVTSDGTPTGTIISFWKFDEETLTWVIVSSGDLNNDRVLYTGNTTIPTLAPTKGIDTVVLADTTRYEWNGTAWLKVDNVKTVFYSGANITNATTTMVAIPALSFNVVPGWYRVKFYPFYNAVNTATGAGFNLGSGTAVRTNQTLKAEIHTTATAMQVFNYSSLAQNYTNKASPRTTDNRAYIEAHFQVTVAGTIIPMFRSENTKLITLRAGSYLTYEKIG